MENEPVDPRISPYLNALFGLNPQAACIRAHYEEIARLERRLQEIAAKVEDEIGISKEEFLAHCEARFKEINEQRN